jgi:hypothetical protein
MALKGLLKCENSFLLLHDRHLITNYRNEKGFSQTIKIENEWFEIVINDLQRETDSIKNFKAEFKCRDLMSGVIKNNIICWPIMVSTQDKKQPKRVYSVI